MKTFLKSNLITILLVIGIFIIGFFAGRWTIKPIENTKYLKGETIRDTITSFIPTKVDTPNNPILPLKHDTIKIPGEKEIITLKVDTSQIIANYIKSNSYKKTLFDNNKDGKLIIDAVVQYNEMQKLGYEFTPIIKKTTVEKRRILTPFVSASYNSFGQFGAGAGIYYYDVGISAKYVTDLKQNGYEIGLDYKF